MSTQSSCTGESRDYGSDLVGPTRADYRGPAQQKMGFEASQFPLDWQVQQATCPEGHTSSSWTPAIDKRKNEVIKLKFSIKDCHACPSRSLCTRSTRYPRRTITIRPEPHYQALQQARERPRPRNSKRCMLAVPGWRERFRKRVRALGLRRSRSIGQEKTPLQHLATAAAMNSVRVVRWLDGKPHAQTRRSALVQLLRPASEK